MNDLENGACASNFHGKTEYTQDSTNHNSNKQINTLLDKFSHFDVNYLVIILVSLSQGITGLSDLAISYLYKDDLKLQPAQVSRINSITTIPWIIKPLYGLITDSCPIFGYRRKPYLFIFGILVIACWLMMSFYVDSITTALTVVLINQTSIAFCSVIGEALVVETSRKQAVGDPDASARNVSLYFFIKSCGSLLTAFSSGALLEYMDKRQVFLITAVFPLMIVLSAFLLNEKKMTNELEKSGIIIDHSYGTVNKDGFFIVNHSLSLDNSIEQQEISQRKLSDQMFLFWTFLKMDQIYKPVIFIFLYMLAPSYSDPLFYFYTTVLEFSPMTMGRLRLIYGIASLCGIWSYNQYFKNMSFKKIMWGSTMLSIFFNMLTIIVVSRLNLLFGISDFFFCMAADAMTTALAEINTMPLLVLACNVCPKNIEGTLYAFFMSVVNLGSLFSNQIGAYLTTELGITNSNFTNLSKLIFIGNIVLLLPMPSLYLIDENSYKRPGRNSEPEEISLVEVESLDQSGLFDDSSEKKPLRHCESFSQNTTMLEISTEEDKMNNKSISI